MSILSIFRVFIRISEKLLGYNKHREKFTEKFGGAFQESVDLNVWQLTMEKQVTMKHQSTSNLGIRHTAQVSNCKYLNSKIISKYTTKWNWCKCFCSFENLQEIFHVKKPPAAIKRWEWLKNNANFVGTMDHFPGRTFQLRNFESSFWRDNSMQIVPWT